MHEPAAGEDDRASERGDAGDEQKEFRLFHPAPEAADVAGKETAGKSSPVVDTLHHSL